MDKVLLIDGNSILNRGFYGLPLLSDKNGVYTNGVLGFLNIFLKVLEETSPRYVIVTFDMHAPTFRHKIFAEYKGTRKPMPEELKMQLPIIREVLKAMGILVLEKEGYEADDLLGTLAKRYQKEGYFVTILSGDRDLLQISDENILISIPKTQGGRTNTHNYLPNDVINEYQVTPSQFIDVKALQGDTADNIPGVPKVGPKTATELIVKYNDLDGVYAHTDELKGKLKENIENNRELAYLSKTLATIDTNAPVDADLSLAECKDYLNNDSYEVFTKYAFKSIISKLEAMKLSGDSESVNKAIDVTKYKMISDITEIDEYLNSISKLSEVGIYKDNSDGIALYTKGSDEVIYICVEGFVTYDYLQNEVKKALSGDKCVVTYKIKNVYEFAGEYRPGFEDVEILSYLDDPIKGDYPISYIGEKYLDIHSMDEKALLEDHVLYAATCAKYALEAVDIIRTNVKNLGEEDLYKNIEMPLSYVLFSMEKEGVLVDRDALKAYSDKCAVEIQSLETKIYEAAGERFNINSPKQLGEILFEKLGLKGGKKTKTGYSTSADVLEKLAPEAPIVSDILEYRTLSKLKSTYADGLNEVVSDDGRIHTHFNQTITATGRISSTEPNLQNIPIRTELGRELRKVFYPKEGFLFLDADYSQIELRLMAHMSKDEKLIEAYRSNKDIHRSTASKVFHVPFEDVTDTMRRNAKAVNFGIIYGISSFGLGKDLDIPVSEAKQYINDYFAEFPTVKAFIDNTVEEARKNGYTRTLFNRVRPIPELKASNFMQRSFGERVAMNAPIQGTAADIMKIAMIGIFNRLAVEAPQSKLLIQVHDEVLLEVKECDKDIVMKIVTEEMEAAADLSVKLEASAAFGSNWYEAK